MLADLLANGNVMGSSLGLPEHGLGAGYEFEFEIEIELKLNRLELLGPN